MKVHYINVTLNENYEIDRRIVKCDYIRYIPAETSTIKTPNIQIYFDIPTEGSVISLVKCYLEIKFEVIKKTDNSRYANSNDRRLVNLGPIASFSDFKLTTNSGKHIEDFSHAHIVSSMYKLITSAKDIDDLSISFDRHRGRRQREFTNTKKYKRKVSCEKFAEGYIWLCRTSRKRYLRFRL